MLCEAGAAAPPSHALSSHALASFQVRLDYDAYRRKQLNLMQTDSDNCSPTPPKYVYDKPPLSASSLPAHVRAHLPDRCSVRDQPSQRAPDIR